MISFAEVKKLNTRGNVIPVFTRVPADLDTPVGVFSKLALKKKNAFLLESIEGGEKLARYSFIGFEPFLIIEGETEQVTVISGKKRQTFDVNPIEFIEELFRCYKPVKVQGLPRFTGGAVGYFSYDTIRWIERIPDDNTDPIGLPMMRFGLYRHLVVFDHLKQEILLIANILHDTGAKGLKVQYDKAVDSLEKIVHRIQKGRISIPKDVRTRTTWHAHYTQPEFEKMVRTAKRYIKEGDIFQVVLSQRWHVTSSVSPLSVYRKLRRLNPSPYMFLLTFDNNAVIGSSPEMLVRVEDKTLETRPIAGTRPRGKNDTEDDKLVADLLADTKELAEHTMLLDLGRNDIGRVSEPGSVVVADKMVIEKYSHVIHIVSSVKGRLSKQVTPLEGLFSCFPAGTVSGAPKVRAMEIIDELEKEKRGIYAGAVAYLDFWGNLDSCIAIRTIVKSGNKYFIQAGAGIVADSEPAREYRETKHKAQVLFEAIKGE